ncbi:MAG: Inner membrane transport permease YhhJ [Elusimicrobia bacterium]|nr:Inner membrane transport permease YhhJ [Elusimicrobiota bacterium]
MKRLANIYHLGIKELISLWRDPVMIALILYAFTVSVSSGSKGMAGDVNNAPIAVVDQDHSPLSERISTAFFPPVFQQAVVIQPKDVDPAMNTGIYTFILDIPPNFARDLTRGLNPKVQLNIDATRMSQAFLGASYVQSIVMDQVNTYLHKNLLPTTSLKNLVVRYLFNPTQTTVWFGSIVQLVNQITLLCVILTGAALMREREHGTLEHLMVMPLQPFDVMMAKIWSNGLVVLVMAALSLKIVVQGFLSMPIAGSIPLFLLGVSVHLFAVTSLGILLGTIARTMPQMGLLVILVILPLQMLSGGNTPYQSMPEFIQFVMQAAPTTHFVRFAQAILFRGAGIEIVWRPFVAELIIGSICFVIASTQFRKSLSAS